MFFSQNHIDSEGEEQISWNKQHSNYQRNSMFQHHNDTHSLESSYEDQQNQNHHHEQNQYEDLHLDPLEFDRRNPHHHKFQFQNQDSDKLHQDIQQLRKRISTKHSVQRNSVIKLDTINQYTKKNSHKEQHKQSEIKIEQGKPLSFGHNSEQGDIKDQLHNINDNPGIFSFLHKMSSNSDNSPNFKPPPQLEHIQDKPEEEDKHKDLPNFALNQTDSINKNLQKQILTGGYMFTKYNYNNKKSNLRMVYVTQDLKFLVWAKKPNSKPLRKFPIDSIMQLKNGRKTKNFEKFQPESNLSEGLSFSLILENRTIDLESKSMKEKQNFIQAFIQLLEGDLH